MRLAKLRVIGYRSIKKDETLVTDQRITILIGANDHGKSNLLAAIRCLNDDGPITPDDRNWDLSSHAPVEITWHFAADEKTIQKLMEFAPKPKLALSPDSPAATDADTEAHLDATAGSVLLPTPADQTASTAASAVAIPAVAPSIGILGSATPATATAPLPAPIPPGAGVSTGTQPAAAIATPEPIPAADGDDDATFPINEANEIVLSRDLESNRVRIVSLPTQVLTSFEKDVLALRPRVELFESPSGNVVDQVTRSELETSPFEFMQGIFRLAGLWDARDLIFDQNDTTSKQLNEASTVLTGILNDQWNQGKNLKWRFEHTGTNGNTIVIKIEDPAIKERFTRPSLRSSGFRTYFLLSMIIYARSQNTPNNSHIYLFDEPGTYLHPSAQLDLQRSFETIADQAQLAYTTHSLFLISKNYPARNRVVSKTNSGTTIDQKPFSKNWKSVRQSLGILLSNNFLIAEKTLLVEGPSDAIYLLDALTKLKATGEIDVDLNDMSIVDAGDSQNYVAMAKIMLSEGRSIVALTDGDAAGKKLKAQLEQACEAEVKSTKLHIHLLPDGKSAEDIFADPDSLRKAIREAFTRLTQEKSRISKEGLNIDEAIQQMVAPEGTTLGKTIDDTTKSWFTSKEKISKLLIAVLYEDEVGSSGASPPTGSVKELEEIKRLLGLRREKSKQSGVFEEVE